MAQHHLKQAWSSMRGASWFNTELRELRKIPQYGSQTCMSTALPSRRELILIQPGSEEIKVVEIDLSGWLPKCEVRNPKMPGEYMTVPITPKDWWHNQEINDSLFIDNNEYHWKVGKAREQHINSIKYDLTLYSTSPRQANIIYEGQDCSSKLQVAAWIIVPQPQ